MKAGVPVGRKAGDFVFHNRRHTAVTNLVVAGVPETIAVNTLKGEPKAVPLKTGSDGGC